MTKVVIDSSAFLAVSYREPGSELVLPLLKHSLVSSVNYTEILGKLLQNGMALERAEDHVSQFMRVIVPHDEVLAVRAAALVPTTRSLGLSLGDRSCLALALHRHLPVLTTNRNWSKLELGIEIRLIRKPSTTQN